MSAVFTVRFWSGALYLMPLLIVIVIVLFPLETFGLPVARSGVGVSSSGFQPYSCRCVVFASSW